jgi:hypothetical protein
MKITNNTIGNYSPYSLNNLPKVCKDAASSKNNISNEEKQFFAKLYPQDKSEIMDYHFYQPSGKMAGVSIGSLFDKRG